MVCSSDRLPASDDRLQSGRRPSRLSHRRSSKYYLSLGVPHSIYIRVNTDDKDIFGPVYPVHEVLYCNIQERLWGFALYCPKRQIVAEIQRRRRSWRITLLVLPVQYFIEDPRVGCRSLPLLISRQTRALILSLPPASFAAFNSSNQ